MFLYPVTRPETFPRSQDHEQLEYAMPNYSQTEPWKFLNAIREMDPEAAIMIANHWGTWPPGISPEQYIAAYNLVTNQAVVPTCRYCEWAVFEGDPHLECQRQLNVLHDEDDDIPDWDDIYEEGDVSTQEVYNRAHTHFGNSELAREATEMYPGDFI